MPIKSYNFSDAMPVLRETTTIQEYSLAPPMKSRPRISSSGSDDVSCEDSSSDGRSGDSWSSVKNATAEPSDSETSKDSATDFDEVIPPDPELSARIIQQVEFYFSDVNITKDAFLLKHVRRNKEGFVSLKLVSSLRRVKPLVKDWRVVALAVAQGSSLLELNDTRTKLRRVDPLPRYDDTAPSRTIIALDLPLEKPSIENVVELFTPCGTLALVRILRPGNAIPADVKPFMSSLPELVNLCALVEFKDADGARCALQRRPAYIQAAPLQWGTMRVLELVKTSNTPDLIKRPTTPATPRSVTPISRSVTPNKERKKRMARPKHTLTHFDYDSSCQSSSDAEAFYDSRRRGSMPCLPLRMLRHSAACSPLASPLRRPSMGIMQTPCSPLRPRPVLNVSEQVLRQPRGPDGTRGFLARIPLACSVVVTAV